MWFIVNSKFLYIYIYNIEITCVGPMYTAPFNTEAFSLALQQLILVFVEILFKEKLNISVACSKILLL